MELCSQKVGVMGVGYFCVAPHKRLGQPCTVVEALAAITQARSGATQRVLAIHERKRVKNRTASFLVAARTGLIET